MVGVWVRVLVRPGIVVFEAEVQWSLRVMVVKEVLRVDSEVAP